MLGIDPSEDDLDIFDKEYPQCKFVRGRYLSPWSRQTEKGLGAVFEYFMNREQKALKLESMKGKSLKDLMRPMKVDMNELQKRSSDVSSASKVGGTSVTWIGHATCYFEMEGVKFITDPVFGERASMFSWVGPKRFFGPGVPASELPIDVVLLSHTHYDHMCGESIRAIGDKALWLVPLGVKEQLEEFGVTNCIEMNWWDSHMVTSQSAANPSLANATGIDVTFTPAKHWTSRNFFDRNQSLWGSFAVVSKSSRVFFSGDTAYCDIFKKIGEKFGPFDLSFIPIGAYKPRYFMKDHHCDPAESVQIHKDLRSKQSLAIHWGTFPLADEDVVEPALELARVREGQGISSNDFFTMRIGETFVAGSEPQGDFAGMNPDLSLEYNTFHQEKKERSEIKNEKLKKIKSNLNLKQKLADRKSNNKQDNSTEA